MTNLPRCTLLETAKPHFSDILKLAQDKMKSLGEEKVTKIAFDIFLSVKQLDEHFLQDLKLKQKIELFKDTQSLKAEDLDHQEGLFKLFQDSLEQAVSFDLDMSVTVLQDTKSLVCISYKQACG